jgi:hypothetical protein
LKRKIIMAAVLSAWLALFMLLGMAASAWTQGFR